MVQQLGLCASNAGGASSIPGRGTSITHAAWLGQKKKIQVNLFTKQKETHRHRKPTYGYQRGKGGSGGIKWEIGIDIYTLLYIK